MQGTNAQMMFSERLKHKHRQIVAKPSNQKKKKKLWFNISRKENISMSIREHNFKNITTRRISGIHILFIRDSTISWKAQTEINV